MDTVCVVIPVYKTIPTSDELLSIRQTLRVLYKHPVALVCPDNLDVDVYSHIAENNIFTVKRFPNSYFTDINGYNRLLLSPGFYQEFKDYQYILICQPDAYVFRDELLEWCNKNYDYIGAPVFGNFSDAEYSEQMKVGNGGFSLRNIQTALLYFNSNKNVFSSGQAAKRISLWKKPQTRVFVWIMMLFGWRNKPLTVSARWKYNEDGFWSGLLDNSNFALKKPSPQEALRFSFDRCPAELFRLNGSKLPFGCHAWRKYQYDSFWSSFISYDDNVVEADSVLNSHDE